MKPKAYAPGQFCWVDLDAHDLDSAAAFYGDLFGWTVEVQETHGGPPYALFRRDGDEVAGVGQMSDEAKATGAPPSWNSYVAVDNADDVTKRAVDAGATVTVPVVQVLDAGRLAFFRDPTGGHVAVWEPARRRGAARVNEPGALCWNELATRDLAGAARFYREVFGWEFRDNPSSPAKYSIIVNRGRDNGGIIEMTADWGDLPPHWSVYFAVADADAATKRIAELGGTVHHGPFDTPVGRMAVAADAQGAHFHVIALTVGM